MSGPRPAAEPARLFLYPMSDVAFRRTVETTFAAIDGGSFRDERLLAAVAALLRPTYPLATVVARQPARGGREPRAWDAFRDDTALDDELLRRARAGVAVAERQLHDRYGALAFGVAVCGHGTPVGRPGSPRGYERGGILGGDATGTDAVDDAAALAFRLLLTEDEGPLTVRVRIARDAWRASRTDAEGTRRPVAPGIVATFLDRHGLTAAEIADVLDLTAEETATLVAEGARPPIIP